MNNKLSPIRKLKEEEALNVFDCVTNDRNHLRISWEDKTLCGIPIKKTSQRFAKFSCYECDSVQDGRYWGQKFDEVDYVDKDGNPLK